MNTYPHHDLTTSNFASSRKVVRFKDGDELITYGEFISGSPSPVFAHSSLPTFSPPISTPSPTITDTTEESSEGPPTPTTSGSYDRHLGERLLMSQELVSFLARRWTFGKDQIGSQWDHVCATRNPASFIPLYIDGLPTPIIIDPPSNMKWISVGHLYRAVEDSLRETISPSDPSSDFNLLDHETKESILQYVRRRRDQTGKARMQKIDFLLGRHVLAGITPCHGEQAWQLMFRGEDEA